MMIDYSKMTNEERQLVTVHLANKVIDGSRNIGILAELFLYFAMGELDVNASYPGKVTIPREKYAKFRGLKNNNFKYIVREIDNVLMNLNKNPLKAYDDEKERYEALNWVSSLSADKKNIYVEFTPSITAFLIYKKGQAYTRVLQDISNFKNAGTVAIKEIIEKDLYNRRKILQSCPIKKLPFIDISIEKLKFKAGLENKYKNTADFKRFFLDKAESELITLNFPIQFMYDLLNSEGEIMKPTQRGAKKVRLYIIDKREEYNSAICIPENQSTIDEIIDLTEAEHKKQYQKIYKQLMEWGIDEERIYSLIEQYGAERIRRGIVVVQKTPKVNSPAGMFLTAIEKDWKTVEQIEEKQVQEKRQKAKTQKQIEQQKKEQKEAKEQAFQQAYETLCESLLTEEKGLNYYYKKAKAYIPGMMLHSHNGKTPEEVMYGKAFTKHQMLYTIQQEYPERFTALFEQYPEKVPVFNKIQE